MITVFSTLQFPGLAEMKQPFSHQLLKDRSSRFLDLEE